MSQGHEVGSQAQFPSPTSTRTASQNIVRLVETQHCSKTKTNDRTSWLQVDTIKSQLNVQKEGFDQKTNNASRQVVNDRKLTEGLHSFTML